MKILFAIQGTGNGHLSRARDIYPELAKYGDVDVLISGIQADVTFPFPVKYRFHGLSFIFGSKGGVDIWKTTKSVKLFQLIKDIRKLPVQDYDLVVNDFEAVAAWACKIKHVPCIALSHQSAVIDKNAPKPREKDWFGDLVLNHYAPHTAAYGFHFAAYSPNIHTPVIRKQIRDIVPTDEGHYTVYLPAYDDETMVEHLSHFSAVQWQVFSKHNKEAFTFKNISVQPIENDAFIKSMASCTGVLCGAGFEGPAEALYLGKKVMAIPMVGQYEQHCNAAGLEGLGVPIIKQLSKKYYDDIHRWLTSTERVKVNFPDNAAKVVEQLMHEQVDVKQMQPAFAK
ncbi:MAG: glycosyl transferase [Bacteroidetes bacterium]|nr:glycosyl transferase [Bacteroidota bacterium]